MYKKDADRWVGYTNTEREVANTIKHRVRIRFSNTECRQVEYTKYSVH
jgi:hypothetical protein